MGRFHEHARDDRNTEVTINYDAIMAGKEGQFVIHEMETFGIPYDVESVMHYGPWVRC